jgi:predicted nucleic acid-binding Zn finger protein
MKLSQDILDGKVAVNVRTEEESLEYRKILKKLGYTWRSGDDLLRGDSYSNFGHKEKHCLYINPKLDAIVEGSNDLFLSEVIKVVKFSDLKEKEMELKEGDEVYVHDSSVSAALDNEWKRIFVYLDKNGNYLCIDAGHENNYLCGEENYCTTSWKYAVKVPKKEKTITITLTESQLEEIRNKGIDV